MSSESDRLSEWVAFCKATRRTCQQGDADRVFYYMVSPYLQSRQMGDAVMRKLGLPSLQPFIDWARAE